METLTSASVRGSSFLVEREPMWDGNVYYDGTVVLGPVVEREPMWDGNELTAKTNPIRNDR